MEDLGQVRKIEELKSSEMVNKYLVAGWRLTRVLNRSVYETGDLEIIYIMGWSTSMMEPFYPALEMSEEEIKESVKLHEETVIANDPVTF